MRWNPRPETIPWCEDDLHEFVYCLICHRYFPTRDPRWKHWMCVHAHLPHSETAESYLPAEDPRYAEQMWHKVGQHFRSSDEMLEGFTCELSDTELLSLQWARESA